MKRNFWSLIWLSFLKIQGILIGIIALAVSVLVWLFSPNINISLGLVLPVLILCIITILIFAYAAYESFKLSERILPKIIYGTTLQAKVLCLLEPSELFSHDTLVSFYYVENSFEKLIGIGTVINIQEDGKIQVSMTNPVQGFDEIITRLGQNDNTILDNIKVKPNIPRTYQNI
ncbi:Uncharacterised protein [uncultured archaeon]|nr:Uncharacterised protein [uncultured archaeon]